MHARHTLEREVSAHHSQCGSQRAHSGASVAHEKFDGFSVLQMSAQTSDGYGGAGFLHAASQLA